MVCDCCCCAAVIAAHYPLHVFGPFVILNRPFLTSFQYVRIYAHPPRITSKGGDLLMMVMGLAAAWWFYTYSTYYGKRKVVEVSFLGTSCRNVITGCALVRSCVHSVQSI